MRVLFVCLGNICRSPLAEGAFARLIAEAGLGDRFTSDSAGVGGWHEGEPPDGRSVEVARRNGVDINRQRARKLRREDLRRFDVVMAMDGSNLADIRALANGGATAEIGLLLDEVPDLGVREVPDPYYGGSGGFDNVWTLVNTGCAALFERLRGRE